MHYMKTRVPVCQKSTIFAALASAAPGTSLIGAVTDVSGLAARPVRG
jgi:hypothetical protein